MEGWLEWFEERAAILEFDAGMTRDAAEREVARVVLAECKRTGTDPGDLMGTRYGHHFYGLTKMAPPRPRANLEVVAYRWRHFDGHERITPFWYSEEEARETFGDRWHEPVEETRKMKKIAIY
jgi:hypothetical protein